MTDLKLNIGEVKDAATIDELAEKIYRSYQARNIKAHSEDFHQFRVECSKQLQSLSKKQMREVSKILLFKYDLRFLGFELIYHHGS
jgi:hypothetical protein